MNNPLLFTDPSGYRPEALFEEEERMQRSGGGNIWSDPFGWIMMGTSYMQQYIIDNSWSYNESSGTYVNHETGQSINPITDYQRYMEVLEPFFYDNSEKNVEWSVEIYSGQATWNRYGNLKVDADGNVAVWVQINSSTITLYLFSNPTGTNIRNQDGYGDGHFGASRGNRVHLGIDLVTTVGQNIVTPVTGIAVNFEGATSKKPIVDITPSDNFFGIDRIRILYVHMPAGISAWQSYDVEAGLTVIGTAANMGDLGYPSGMTPHVHIQIMQNDQWVDPTPFFFID